MARSRSTLAVALCVALAALALAATAAEAARPLRHNGSHGRKLKTFGLLNSIVSTTGGGYYNNRYSDDDRYFYPNTATYYPTSNYGWGYTGGYVPRPSYSSYSNGWGYGRPSSYYGGWGGYPYRSWGYGK